MIHSQSTSHILMVEPIAFCVNPQTLATNAFQKQSDISAQNMNDLAILEHQNMVDLLELNGIKVTVLKDTLEPHTPDSLFPNNWFSTHQDGKIVLYPMCNLNRRAERKPAILDFLNTLSTTKNILDFTEYEGKDMFLEGTGSLVLDRVNKIAYACVSARTNADVMKKWCEVMNYTPVIFSAVDTQNKPIYHTNVVMGIGTNWAVLCLDSIPDPQEKELIIKNLEETKHEIIEISFDQMENFAGNMLEVCSKNDQKYVVMSTTAFACLNDEQKTIFKKYVEIIIPNIPTIEQAGGGSVRCMMAEIFC